MQKQALTEYSFKTALMDFQKLKQQNTLPNKMHIKLQYLQNKILGRKLVSQEYKQLPEYELQSLEQCDTASQTILFTSIVKCLSGKEVIVYFKNQKAYVKKQQAFSLWTKCYISCDSVMLYMKKKATKKTNYYEFKIRSLKVSRKYIEYKGRMCFGLMHENKKYMLGFEQETACERIFKVLKELVKDNRPEQGRVQQPKSQQVLANSQKSQQMTISNHMPSFPKQPPPTGQQFSHSVQYMSIPKQDQLRLSQNSQQIMQYEQDYQQQSEQQLNMKKEQQFYKAIREQVTRQNLSNDSEYKLMRNFEIGRLLVCTGMGQEERQVKTKTSIILSLPRLDAAWLLEHYLQMQSWNLHIQQSRIISKISPNSYKIFLQFKKYSLMSLARWTIATVTVVTINNKVYLLVRSCEQLTEEELALGNYMSTVKMKKFTQTVEISRKCDHDQKTLMTILTVTDFGGYCSRQDNLNMTLVVLSNFQNFHNFVLQQAIAKEYEERKSQLFELNNDKLEKRHEMEKSVSQGPSTMRKKSQSVSMSEMSLDDMEEDKSDEKEFQMHRSNKNILQCQVQSTLSTKHTEQLLFQKFLTDFTYYQRTTTGTQQLVYQIMSKVQERYFLKHKFVISERYITTAQRYHNDPASDNWLLQNGKWRVSGIEMIFTNEEILAQQKNVIRLILKQLSSNVMSGRNIMNMSLPVEIFEDKSFLEKLAEMFGLFPYYFNIAAKQKNIVKQITLVTQAFAYAPTICPNIEKPFNPILGETYQCTIGGVTLSLQQISHHPPVSAFYIKTDEYQCYGSQHPVVDIGLNTAVAKNTNPIFINFYQTNTRYIGYGQDFQIGGLIFGHRTYKNSGKVNVFQQKNQILCELSYGKAKKHIYQSPKKLKTGEIIGGVFKVSNAFTRRFKHAQWKNFEGIKYDEKIEELAKIHGNWMGDFYIDGTKVRGMYDITPYKPVKDVYVLPSDCSYRLDVYYKKMGDMKKSQQWKEVMENMQRKERKLREENGGAKH